MTSLFSVDCRWKLCNLKKKKKKKDSGPFQMPVAEYVAIGVCFELLANKFTVLLRWMATLFLFFCVCVTHFTDQWIQCTDQSTNILFERVEIMAKLSLFLSLKGWHVYTNAGIRWIFQWNTQKLCLSYKKRRGLGKDYFTFGVSRSVSFLLGTRSGKLALSLSSLFAFNMTNLGVAARVVVREAPVNQDRTPTRKLNPTKKILIKPMLPLLLASIVLATGSVFFILCFYFLWKGNLWRRAGQSGQTSCPIVVAKIKYIIS